MPYQGILKAWHRNAAVDLAYGGPIFNVDFYLDESDKYTALWPIPWSHERAADYLGFETFDFLKPNHSICNRATCYFMKYDFDMHHL